MFWNKKAAISQADVEQQLASWKDPYLPLSLLDAKVIKSLQLEAGKLSLNITLGFPASGWLDEFKASLLRHLEPLGLEQITLDVDWKVEPHKVKPGIKALPGVRNLIAVASGKGGVGKSTTAVNLALALQADGARVGILDADIYGPSQPIMLGVADQKPEVLAERQIRPVEAHGLQVMSIGFLVDDDQAMVWRGPMVSGALQQLLNDCQWQDLDYLIVDLPPGTGDIQLTLAQKVPVTASVIVTTPQDIALADARKGITMFGKVSIPVLGIIENMSLHVCSQCGHADPIFGSGGGEKLAERFEVPFLGRLPLDASICAQADSGRPTLVAEPDGAISQQYRQIARSMSARLSLEAKNYAARFPTIVIEQS